MYTITIVSHGLKLGGIQITTLEMIDVLRNEFQFNAILCDIADKQYVKELIARNVNIIFVPCSHIQMYPIMYISNKRKVEKILEQSDIIWIVDEIHHVAAKLRKIKQVPIIAHIHSYAMICHWWGAAFGFNEVCINKCNISRIIHCKKLINEYLYKWGFLSLYRNLAYRQLDLIKGPLDYILWPMRRIIHDLIKKIDAFVFPSYYSKNVVLRHLSEISEHGKIVDVIYNPVVLPKVILNNVRENKEDYLVIYPSGFNIMKGFHVLLHAIPYIYFLERDIKFIMVGINNDEPYVYKIIKKYNINRNIIKFIPKLPRSKLLKLIASANLLTLPIVIPDPAPRVVVEALKLGIPVIGSNIGGLREFVKPPVSGMLIEPNNVEQLISSIIKAKYTDFDKEYIRRMAFQKFNNKRFRMSFNELIEKVLYT